MKNVARNLGYWLTGTVVALGGAIFARQIAPHFESRVRVLATAGGQIIALIGLFIICLGVRRRLREAGKKESSGL